MFKQKTIKELKEARKQYEEELACLLGNIPEARTEYETLSGIPVKGVYTPLDIAGSDYSRDIALPGQYPYTRGLFPAGFRSRRWNVRQVVGLGTAEETNQRWKYLLAQGQTALAVVGAVKNAMGGYGYDTDDERTIGFAGKDGIQMDTLYDFETLFDGIDLTKASIHLITSSAMALACYIAVAEQRGMPLSQLRGSMSNQVRPSRECFDIIEYCAQNVPNFNATYIDVRNIREAGCNAPQEVGFGVALGIAAAEAMAQRGVDIDQFAPRVTWFVNSGPEFFEEVAKFRAMRRLWARTMHDKYGAKDPRSWRMRAHVQTYAPSLTYQQPLNNIVRSTLYALAAVLGGGQSMSVNSFDEVLAIPTELSATISVRTQQIIYFESGVAEVADPLGGSYYVEWLTGRLEEEAAKIVDEIQSRGGAFKARTWMEQQVRAEAIKRQRELDTRKRIRVGVNAYEEEDDLQLKLVTSADLPLVYEYDPAMRDKQIARLNKARQMRDPVKVEQAKRMLYEAFQSGKNMMPTLIEAVKAYLSSGELSEVCCQALGTSNDYFFYDNFGFFPAS